MAWEAVKFAEQVGIELDIHGTEKFNKAASVLAERVESEFGILLTDKEIEVLVKAALREIKDQFGEQWAQAVKND